MQIENTQQVSSPLAKALTAWAAIGITSWAEAASFVAFVYSSVLLGEWLWKRLVKPIAQQRGWIKGDKDGDQ